MPGDKQKMDAGATATEGETQSPYERAQGAVSKARDYRNTAMYTEWDVIYDKAREAVDLSHRMEATTKTAVEDFGYDSYFDFRGLAIDPESSGLRVEDLSSDEKTGCITTALVLADMEPEAVRGSLVNMRAFALARDASRADVQAGGNMFRLTARTTLLNRAEDYRQQATQEIGTETDENVQGAIDACAEIRNDVRNQVAEKSRVDQAIQERKAREEQERQEAVEKARRESAKQVIDDLLDVLQKYYGKPLVSLSDSKGI